MKPLGQKFGGVKADFVVFDEADETMIMRSIYRARNWGLVCGFGYGFAAATFAFLILLFVTAPHA